MLLSRILFRLVCQIFFKILGGKIDVNASALKNCDLESPLRCSTKFNASYLSYEKQLISTNSTKLKPATFPNLSKLKHCSTK